MSFCEFTVSAQNLGKKRPNALSKWPTNYMYMVGLTIIRPNVNCYDLHWAYYQYTIYMYNFEVHVHVHVLYTYLL